jgi:uncharacterized membrane protein YfhO
LGLLTGAVFWLKTRNGALAGSKVDWISQHTAFAEYFRSRFYQTHDLFPQFAAEISGGVNIYYFAYYGLMNPFYLLSYAFPWIPMTVWMMGLSVVCYWLDGCLTLKWLSKHFPFIPSLCGALVLMLSSSLVYQSSAQVMFVSYFPFLIGLLIGVDQRREKHSWLGMFLCTIGIVLNSFFYIPSCLLVLCIYIWASQSVSRKRLKDFFATIRPAIEGGLVCMFYLLPVVFAIFGGRSASNVKSSMKSLFMLKFDTASVLYSPYGIGITLSGLWILCVMIFSRTRKASRMSRSMALCFILPVLIYILNGTLYVRGKVLIPFAVLCAYVCAVFIYDLRDHRIDKAQCLKGTACLGILFLLVQGPTLKKHVILILIGVAVGLLLTFAVKHAARVIPWILTISMAVCSTAVLFIKSSTSLTYQELLAQHDFSMVQALKYAVSQEDEYTRSEVRGTSYLKDQQNMILVPGQNITTGYASLNNPYYLSVRRWLSLGKTTRNVLMQDAQDNPLFLRLMGVEYIVGKTDMIDYTKIKDNLYINEDVAPVFYLTSQTASEETFNNMNWAQRQLTLMQTACVPSRTPGTAVSLENYSIVLNHDTHISSDTQIKTTITFPEPLTEKKYLFISFYVENHAKKDVTITIDQVRNRLSASDALYYNGNTEFHYVIALTPGTDSLSVTLGSGDYTIYSLKAMVGDVSSSASVKLYENPVDIVLDKDGNGFHGDTSNTKGHWLITSIPYSDEFTITADGKKVTPQKVNHGFLGAYFKTAPKHIEIRFRAKGSYEGLCLSIIFLILILILHGLEGKRARPKSYGRRKSGFFRKEISLYGRKKHLNQLSPHVKQNRDYGDNSSVLPP